MVTPAKPPDQDGTIVPHDLTLTLYRKMLTTFYVDERLKVFARHGKCTFHASTRGHEKIQAAMTLLLQPRKDWYFTYYREKGIALGLGLPLRDLFLAMLSRAGDPSSNARNMPEHFSSPELNLVSQTACTGTQYLPAVGMARALRKEGSDAVVYVSSGEGATSEGEFFEALNWAARDKLPVLFVIQNNGYAISVPQSSQTVSEVHRIARGFGMPSYDLDGTWFEPMYQTLPPVIRNMREGGGPALVEARVVRMDSHSSSDDQRKYRSAEELAELLPRDPIHQTEQYLLRHGVLSSEEVAGIRAAIREEVDRAADEADAAPIPEESGVMAHIFAGNAPETARQAPPRYLSDEPVALIDALNHGLREEMESNPKIVMWGEDIADPKGGVFGVTRGLSTAYPERVRNSPLAEASIVGVAGGMAIAGYKPIVEIQFADYLWPGFMQLRDEIATVRWRSQGKWTCPVVVRIAVGGYIKGGPWHSACVEAAFAHIPGWYVVFPSCAEDAKGLIKTAARSVDPVIFLEHKGLYRRVQARSPEPDGSYLIPFGQGRVRREGSDVTVVTWGSAVYLALEAARRAEKRDLSIEVLDLRSIVPLDEEIILKSVRKTNRVVVAHEDTLTMGFGAEVAARIGEKFFEHLDAPVVRVAARDTFVPSAANLELAVLPSVEDVERAVEQVAGY